MFCPKCGEKNNSDSMFCCKCGTKIEIIEKTKTENTIGEKKENKKDDICIQVNEYNTLPWYKSYRKISALLFVFSSLLTIVMVSLGYLGSEYLFDLILIIPLSIFMYKGKKWAFIVSIVYWVICKVYQMYLNISLGNGIIAPLAWLIGYVSVFYKALKVEWQKDKIKNKNN